MTARGRRSGGADGPGAVRISAGRWKGRRLEVPPGTRPTAGRAREALFDILGSRVPGARFLDLHAGSGAVGIEAVSRGAQRATLVEIEAAVLRLNVARFSAGDSLHVLESDAGEAVRLLAGRSDRFDIVFSDPPYGPAQGAAEASPLGTIARLVAPGGVVVVQRDARPREAAALAPAPEGLALVSTRRYGRNVLDFFETPGRGERVDRGGGGC